MLTFEIIDIFDVMWWRKIQCLNDRRIFKKTMILIILH